MLKAHVGPMPVGAKLIAAVSTLRRTGRGKRVAGREVSFAKKSRLVAGATESSRKTSFARFRAKINTIVSNTMSQW